MNKKSEYSDINKAAIENFVINNKYLSQIESHLNRFNPIKIMKMESMEIRHSAILSWLLNPRENHGLNDEFLRCFLAEVLKNTNKDSDISAIDLYNTNLHDANVYTEWNQIDIFIECPVNRWVFIIENKVHASQRKDQLKDYAGIVMARYKDYVKTGVFLTLNEEEPDDEKLDVKFHSIRYSDVIVLLNQVINQFEESLSVRVLNFIKYYLEIISELCDMNEKTDTMKKLARKVYQENKAVIDFIVEHSSSTEFQYAVSHLIYPKDLDSDPDAYDEFKVGDNTFVYFSKTKKQFSFLPKTWVDAIGEVRRKGKEIVSPKNYLWGGCESWWASYPLICWIQLDQKTDTKGIDTYSLKLFTEVGSLDDNSLRLSLINMIEKQNNRFVSFGNGAKDEGRKYSKFLNYKNNVQFEVPIEDSQDFSEIKEKIKSLLNNFSEHVVCSINKSLVDFKVKLTLEKEND